GREWQAVVTKGDGTWRLHRYGGRNALDWTCDGLTYNEPARARWAGVVGSMPVADGRWHHVAGVYDGERSYLYVDGQLDASRGATGSINTGTHPVCIGHNAEQSRGGRNSLGTVDDVRVYKRALSADEVKALAGVPGAGGPIAPAAPTAPTAPAAPAAPTSPTQDLVAHWKLDDRQGAVAKDSSGNGNDGTIKGAAKWTRGKRNGALLLSGEKSCVRIENEAPFDITERITVAVWMKSPPFTKEHQAIVTKGDDA
ncbi:MAG: LamG domain-containing protein, partial [Planctomycetota bacterium]